MIAKTFNTLTVCALACLFLANEALAVLQIEITQGVDGSLPVAVIPFGWEGPASTPPEDIAGIIAANLRRSGRFSPLPEKDLVATPNEGSKVDFHDWRLLGVENIVVGKLIADGGRYSVQFQLYDVFKATQIAGYSILSTSKDLRHTAHQISDIIYEALVGQRGAFATRVLYVADLKNELGKREYVLNISDSDGHNARPILSSERPIMSPSWSPDGRHIAYVSFEKNNSEIFIQDLASGDRELISSFPGLNGAPAWSPEGTRLAIVLSKGGNPDIYILDLPDKSLRRVTRSYAIDTEPVWGHDGQTLFFTSDRGGKPQIYRIPVRGGNAQRISYEGGYNARPMLSPDGKLLAMVHGENGRYNIAVLELATRQLRVLTNAMLDESPSFAPNGSMIIYATQHGERGVLSAVSVDGRVRQRLVLQEGDVREPAWSPFKQ